jgi:hypothetical protein
VGLAVVKKKKKKKEKTKQIIGNNSNNVSKYIDYFMMKGNFLGYRDQFFPPAKKEEKNDRSSQVSVNLNITDIIMDSLLEQSLYRAIKSNSHIFVTVHSLFARLSRHEPAERSAK